jgi:NADH-quinone oxidoreductase subunit F
MSVVQQVAPGVIERRSAPLVPAVDLRIVEEVVQRHGAKPDAVLPILQDLQDFYGYLPEAALKRVCEISSITPAAITGVSSFYDMFRHAPVGKHIVRVCRGTACHVNGAERVEDALRRELGIPAGQDTDPQGQFTVEQVACLGCCTLAPVVRVDDATFGHAKAEGAGRIIHEFHERERNGVEQRSTEDLPASSSAVLSGGEIRIGLGSCCIAKGSDAVYHALQDTVAASGSAVTVKRVGCVGMCHRTPLIEVKAQGSGGLLYAGLDAAQAQNLVRRHFRPRNLLGRASDWLARAIDSMLLDDPAGEIEQARLDAREPAVAKFLDPQVHLATEGFGHVDPLNLDEYLSNGGFSALARCLRHTTAGAGSVSSIEPPIDPDHIPELLEKSGLRGRGGAGYPTGAKWRLARDQVSTGKYVICNGDEGDPGAFMDRMLLESFPFRIIEGLAIAAVAIEAQEAIFYIRHEYPLALKRVRAAIKLLQLRGWLGERLLGHDYPLKITIKKGGGAFICGEETALIESIEGRRGNPRLRPPFPAQRGLWGKPTIINNVETLALVPWILRHGPRAFAAYGTARSKGTKVFALAGAVQRGGLIEIPMGITIRQIVEDVGGGVWPGRKFKAVQIGGPSGGCIPERLADTPVDFESLRKVGAIMGSGGLVVLDDTACMVDIARYFLQFTQQQSCGKCTFCRIGTRRMLDILDRLCTGKAQPRDLMNLETLSRQVGAGSLCGLGKTAPNPVLTTLHYFRKEYEAHLQGRCPAGKCAALIKYHILENCTGCTICSQHCPVAAIPMTPYLRHWIDLEKCTRCDSCRQVCPHNAVGVT